MNEYKLAEVKFNGGRGALLCNTCRVIIATGMVHEDKEHFCEECRAKADAAMVKARVNLKKKQNAATNKAP